MYKSIKSFILILLFLLLAGCTAHIVNPLYNWKPIEIDKHPNIVAIVVADESKTPPYKLRCSGVIIRPNVVLSAGHCLDGWTTDNFQIISHCSNIRSKDCKRHNVKYKIFQPGYKQGWGSWNDLGLFILEKEIPDIKPAEIADLDEIHNDTPLVLAGYGRRPNGIIGVLYAGKNAILDFTVYEFRTYHGGENGVCRGDSGSPAFIKTENGLKLVGILSRSARPTASSCGGISEYTVPILYWDWIERMIRITK